MRCLFVGVYLVVPFLRQNYGLFLPPVNEGFNGVVDILISFLLGLAIAVNALIETRTSSIVAAHDCSAVSFSHLPRCSINLASSEIGLPSAQVTLISAISHFSCCDNPAKGVVKFGF